MALTKKRIGDLVEIVDERNDLGIRDFYGININKEFMPTAARTDNLDESKYKLVTNGRFVFSGMQTGRDECIRISMYTGEKPIIVSPAYTTFEVKATDAILPMYFFMIFMSKEKDRLGWFYSDSSIRSNLDWDRFCEIELSLPPISIQQKYVDVYNSMLANQQSYERGLEDLKLVCDAYIEKLRRDIPSQKIGPYLRECDEKNTDLSVTLTQGVDVNMQFIPAKREAVDKGSTRIVRNGQFAFNKVVKSNGTKLPIALRDGEDCIISGSYQVFEVADKEHLLPEYLMLWMARSETQRRCGFNAWGSTRDVFPFDELCKLEFPIPDISIQQDIVNIYDAYVMRKGINDRLKERIKNMCPILIKGSLEEAGV
jgi:type I restriction enzyme S subunit